METVQKGIILLIKSAITGQAQPLPEEFDIRQAAPILLKNRLLTLGYTGAVNCGIDPQNSVMLKIQERYFEEYMLSDHQMQQLEKVFDAFEANGIQYMPLKGTVMKAKYPSHELRIMLDADILIREEQRRQIGPVMEQLGFTQISESDHEWNWLSCELKIELHKRLVSSDDKDYYAYFGEGWQFARHQSGNRYCMTEEDAFLFEFTHFTRHYCTSGVSVRHIIDLWVHLYSNEKMDLTYIRENLEKMRLGVFFDNVMTLIQAWFGDGKWDDRTEFMSDYIFRGGVRDSVWEQAKAIQKTGDAKAGKKHLLWSRIFPAKKHIEWNYPQLKNVPLLFAWVARWFLLLTVRRKNVENRTNAMQNVSQESAQAHLDGLAYVGLQFSE